MDVISILINKSISCMYIAGLVSNLSNSFTRWRRNSNENGKHNCSNVSDKSTMSALMLDQVSLVLWQDDSSVRNDVVS